MSLSTITDAGLENALATVPRDSIVLIEDIDAQGVNLNRTEDREVEVDKVAEQVESAIGVSTKRKGLEAMPTKSNSQAMTSYGITMSGILNAIDGIAGSNGRILIATTNHPERLDKALVRPGRFDLTMNIGYLVPETFIKMFGKFYPDFKIKKNVKFAKEISPATFQYLAMCNLKSPEKVLKQVMEK